MDLMTKAKHTPLSAESTITQGVTVSGQYAPDISGYYGEFGGAFIPEMLYHNVETLRKNYLKIVKTKDFQKQFKSLLRDYVGRPTPLYYAERLSQQYNCHILLKREDLCHTGAHKVNNTIGQILLAQRLGKKRIIAETGAGQHGVATATVCALMGMPCIVYMGSVDIERQAPNVARMKMLGAEVRPATSGSQTLKDATNEAIRDWINNPEDTHYIIGSVVGPHPYPDMVARFQSIISEEIIKQIKQKGFKKPNYVIACVGGGSNAAGAFYHFLDDPSVQLVAVEAAGEGIRYERYNSRLTNPLDADRRWANRGAALHISRFGLSWYWATSCAFDTIWKGFSRQYYRCRIT
jgi:tryptophan synthase beta chain